MLKPTCLLFAVFLAIQTAGGQGIVLENNPATLEWKEIITENFNVIFPAGFEREGLRMANTLEHIHGPVSASLGKKPRPIPIILQNQGVISNGFVALGPRRSEFYTTPPQDYKFLGNNDWLNTLAVHEYRHVVQYDKAITGLSKLAFWVFGEDILAGLSFISTPLWFWEGDAVGAETAFTSSGRGRIPYFQALHRANVLDRGGFSYHKQYLRSYKHAVPNHYLTGYLMTTFLRRTYGPDVLAKVTERSFGNPIMPFTFSRALRRETGKSLIGNYRLMSAEMDSLYHRQVAGLELTKFENIVERSSALYTEYAFPQPTSDGNVVAIRYGIGNIPQLVTLQPAGDWKVLHTLGIWEDNGYLTSNGEKVVWNEIFFDARWERRTYSGIRVYDLKTGELTTLGKNGRFKGAGISPDGRQVVTVEASQDNTFSLLILDVESGELIRKFDNPANAFYSMPQFSKDGLSIVALKHSSPSKSIVQISLGSGAETVHLTSSSENLGHPVLSGDLLFFASDRSGIDDIYAYELSTKNTYKVTTSRLAAYNPSVSQDGLWLYYNEMTKDGWDVVKVAVDKTVWQETPVSSTAINYFDPLLAQEDNENLLDGVPDTAFGIKPYRQYQHLLRPYGWGWVNTLDDSRITLGFYSQNILSTLYLDAGYNLSLSEGTGYWTANLSYQGLYPIIDVGYLNGTRNVVETVDGTNRLYSWDESGVSGGLRVPFNFTHSKYVENAEIGASVQSTTVENYNNPIFDIDQQRNGTVYSTQYTLSYSRLLKQSKRDIYPRLGQSVSLYYFDTPFRKSDYFSSLLSGEGYIYLPGLFQHHSVRLRAAWQQEDIVNYRFRSEVQFVRGFSYSSFNTLATLSANYALPLLYPDLALGSFLYVQRLRANVFYDFGRGTTPSLQRNFNSFGIDIFADLNVMRFLPEFSPGVRIVYVPERNTYLFNVLLGSIGF